MELSRSQVDPTGAIIIEGGPPAISAAGALLQHVTDSCTLRAACCFLAPVSLLDLNPIENSPTGSPPPPPPVILKPAPKKCHDGTSLTPPNSVHMLQNHQPPSS